MLLALLLLSAATAHPVDRYNVAWDSPSENSSGSMPLGNGDVGVNAWVERGGDLLFYISETDAWSAHARLLKLGRVRVKFTPNPFTAGALFRQELKLSGGEIEIRAGEPEVRIRLWVDANQPVIWLETESRGKYAVQASFETWRARDRPLGAGERDSAYGMIHSPEPVIETADTVLPERAGRIVWYHRNTTSIWGPTLKLQGLEKLAAPGADPLLNRTFGGAIVGPRSRRIAIHVLTAQTANADEWVRLLERRIAAARHEPEAHRKWWNGFWQRSWIRASGTREAEAASRGYALQRFISACAGRGAYPIKFNGSIFNVDSREPKESFDADYRRWGGPYWFQNTRLAYWPMLASGDYEMMEPLFRMYLDALPLAGERTRVYYGHEGAFFPETMYFWGAFANDNYGWDRQGKHISYVQNTYIRYYWQGALELLAMGLDRWAHTRDARAKESLLSLAGPILTFYDRHYRRDAQGKLLFQPASALETWHEAVNPLPEIAGLAYVLPRLLELDPRPAWKRLLGELPPVPMKDGRLVAAQELIGPIKNTENPELYAIFPFRLYGAGKPELEMARRTFEARRIKRTGGWTQDPIQAAFLGLTDTAAQMTVSNFTTYHKGSRFPAFWGPNFDWIPDQDHGTVALMALQTMLMQTEGRKIRLLPAWPREWDVEFKLHAPMNTAVEGVYRGGRMVSLTVSPAERRADVVRE